MHGRSKDDDRVRQAVETHLPAIWRFAFVLSGDADTADDLTQAACLRAIEKAHQFQDERCPLGWLLTICRSIWLNQIRAEKLRTSKSLDAAAALNLFRDPSDVETTLAANRVLVEVMALPEAQRETVILVYVEGFTYREAAKILSVPIGTVMSRLSVARKKLSKLRASALDGDKSVVGR